MSKATGPFGEEVEDSWLVRFASTSGGCMLLGGVGLSLAFLAMGVATWLAHR